MRSALWASGGMVRLADWHVILITQIVIVRSGA